MLLMSLILVTIIHGTKKLKKVSHLLRSFNLCTKTRKINPSLRHDMTEYDKIKPTIDELEMFLFIYMLCHLLIINHLHHI